MNQAIDYHAILPETILSGTILLVLIADAFLKQRRKWFTMPLAFIGMNSDGRIVSWNAQAVSTLGWTLDEAVGRSLAELIIPRGFREAHAALREAAGLQEPARGDRSPPA